MDDLRFLVRYLYFRFEGRRHNASCCRERKSTMAAKCAMYRSVPLRRLIRRHIGA